MHMCISVYNPATLCTRMHASGVCRDTGYAKVTKLASRPRGGQRGCVAGRRGGCNARSRRLAGLAPPVARRRAQLDISKFGPEVSEDAPDTLSHFRAKFGNVELSSPTRPGRRPFHHAPRSRVGTTTTPRHAHPSAAAQPTCQFRHFCAPRHLALAGAQR